MSELLMDLADGGSPERLLGIILRHHPAWSAPIPLEELARTVGILELKELEVDGFEGALMTNPDKTEGVILVKVGTRPERWRFTVAHELGHFLMPTHKGNRQCTAADLRESRRDTEYRRQEAEANRFAAGLLMPRPWFTRDMRQLGDADVAHVQELAATYKTSLEATINRYVELTDDRCAFVFSKDGIVRYARCSSDFPQLAVRATDPLPANCASLSTSDRELHKATSWQELDGSVWLETSRGNKASAVLEQSIRQYNGYQVTLLFVEAAEDEEEDELEKSWAPRFQRR